jgi:hypothetical protein
LQETEGYDVCNIENADETDLFCNLEPHKTLTFQDFFHDSTESKLLATCSLAGFLLNLFLWTLKMEAICSSETSLDTQLTTRRYIPEDCTLHEWHSLHPFGVQFEDYTCDSALEVCGIHNVDQVLDQQLTGPEEEKEVAEHKAAFLDALEAARKHMVSLIQRTVLLECVTKLKMNYID